MSRWRAVGIHLGVSVAVGVMLLLLIVSLWFPGVLFRISGGLTGLLIVMGVDVVLGPLLTLVVFKPGKPGLKLDMACIVTLQVLCLMAGIWIVRQERPLAIVYAYDTFYSVKAQDFAIAGADRAALDRVAGGYPKLVLVDLPADPEAAGQLAFQSQFGGQPLFMQTDRYREFPPQPESIMRNISLLRRQAEEQTGRTGAELAGCLIARFVSAETRGFVCFDAPKRRLSQHFD